MENMDVSPAEKEEFLCRKNALDLGELHEIT
jgi:hypothetical protein